MTIRRLAGLLALALMALPPAPAMGAKVHPLDSYCSPTGDYCTAVLRRGGRTTFLLRTFSFRGSYGLCVKPPDERRECRAFKLVRARHGIFASRIDFARNFAHRARGRYAVSWHKGDAKLGRTLHFRKR